MHKNSSLIFWKNYVRRSRQISAVEPKSKSSLMKERPYFNLRSGTRACHQLSEEDVDGSEVDCCEEVTLGFVITGSDSPEVLELEEEVLDKVAVFVAFGVVGAGCKSVGFGWDDGLDAFGLKEIEHPCLDVVGFVSREIVGLDLRQ